MIATPPQEPQKIKLNTTESLTQNILTVKVNRTDKKAISTTVFKSFIEHFQERGFKMVRSKLSSNATKVHYTFIPKTQKP